MKTGKYHTNLDKVALAVESIKVAKQMAVTDDTGDINITLFCWKGPLLVSVAQMTNTFDTAREDRINRLMQGTTLLRRGWGVDGFTLIAEGYCSLKPADTKNEDLSLLFAAPESPVKECISFTHVDQSGFLFVSLPYAVGKKGAVDFSNPLWYKGRDTLRDIAYPATLKTALTMPIVDIDDESIDKEVFFATLTDGLMTFGFEVFYRDDV